jgi:SnoaL-like domain
MAGPSNEEIVRRYMAALRVHDSETLSALRHPDWTAEYPQSRERIRGNANERAMMAAFTGGVPEPRVSHVVGAEDRWVVSPMYTIERVVGSGDAWWGDGMVTYPDGAIWCVVALLELRDGLVLRETEYFAEPFAAPAWRAPFVESMD